MSNGSEYSATVIDINDDTRAQPKILEFSHAYGSAISPNDTIWFSFAKAGLGHPEVVPSGHPSDPAIRGKFTSNALVIL